MNKKFLTILIFSLIFVFGVSKAIASLTFSSTAITGTADTTIDVGSGQILNLQTTNNGAITTGSGAFTMGGNLISPIIRPASNSTTAIQINKADGTSNVLNVDTTNSRIGIGTTTPSTTLHIDGGSTSGVVTLQSNSAAYMSIYRYSNNSTRGRYEMYKARGTSTTPLVIQTGDELGSIDFYGYDGSAFQRNAIIYTTASDVTGATITPRISFGLGPSAGANDYYMSVSAAGVVIGSGSASTTPSALLHIKSNSFILTTPQTPASAAATCVTGTHAWDTSYMYVCVATNTWKRAALSTW